MRIGHNVLDLLLGIVTASVRIGILLVENFIRALRQLGILLDFDSPSLIVCQVPVESVDLVLRQEIKKPLNRGNRKEVPPDIEQYSSIREARIIGEVNRR